MKSQQTPNNLYNTLWNILTTDDGGKAVTYVLTSHLVPGERPSDDPVPESHGQEASLCPGHGLCGTPAAPHPPSPFVLAQRGRQVAPSSLFYNVSLVPHSSPQG